MTWHPDGSGDHVTTFEGIELRARFGEGAFYESPTFEVFSEGVYLGGFDFWPWEWKIPGVRGFLKRLLWCSMIRGS